jgi:hypothetical protein
MNRSQQINELRSRNPQVLQGVSRFLQKHGVANVVVGMNSAPQPVWDEAIIRATKFVEGDATAFDRDLTDAERTPAPVETPAAPAPTPSPAKVEAPAPVEAEAVTDAAPDPAPTPAPEASKTETPEPTPAPTPEPEQPRRRRSAEVKGVSEAVDEFKAALVAALSSSGGKAIDEDKVKEIVATSLAKAMPLLTKAVTEEISKTIPDMVAKELKRRLASIA